MYNMRASSGLGVNVTPDLVNDFFSIKPKGQQAPLKYQKHHAGTANLSRACPSGGVTPGNAFNVNDVQYFEQTLQFGYDAAEDERVEDVNRFLLPEPIDDETYRSSAPQEMSTEIYDNYSFVHTYDASLPITDEQERIIQTIEANRVTIIQGSTGCGKTTQVPQYILDHYQQKRKFCNILVTQPRKIAATSVARRVSDERNWPLKTLVGFQIQLRNEVSEDTRITYLTTGVLLQKMIKNKNLNDYTHVILDEVHERDQDIDFAMLVVRYYLKTVSKHVKVVLMSATADCTLFSNYFAMLINNRKEGAPVLTVEGRMYDVTEYYFEDLQGLSEIPKQRIEEPEIDDKCYKLCTEVILSLDREELAQEYAPGRIAENRGSVLVFLPGRYEIETMYKHLDEYISRRKLNIMVLHSDITSNVQGEVFIPSDRGVRKVILSTNIAESSITVPDVKYVIDFCLTKQSEVDRDTKFNRLVLKWASKASLIQRRGRAGRVQNGHCFRMISNHFFEELDEHSQPEMQRASLEQLILKVKLLDLGPSPSMTLQLAIQPPRVSDIKKTILLLKEVGALTLYQNGRMNALDGDLTFVGRVLGKLPLDIHLGKLLLIGYAFGVLEECLIIAACLSLKSLFSKTFRDELGLYRTKMIWAHESSCDLTASLDAYMKWKYHKLHNGFGVKEQDWAKKIGLEYKRFREVDDLVEKLRRYMVDFNMHTHRNIYRREHYNKDELMIQKDTGLILKLVIAGAFYPNYFLSQEIDEAEAAKTLSGYNPCTTVLCNGSSSTLEYYRMQVARLFRQCGKGSRLHFENTRLFVEFDKEMHYSVSPALLVALKMRQLRMPMHIWVSKKKDDQLKLKKEKTLEAYHPETGLRTNRLHTDLKDKSGKLSVSLNTKQVKMKNVEYIYLVIQHAISPSRFWATYADKETLDLMHVLNTKINCLAGKNLSMLEEEHIKVGALCCALFEDEFFRAEIRVVQHAVVQVFFVDFGNTAEIYDRYLIRKCPEALESYPYQAFECSLCQIRPLQGTWGGKALARFSQVVPVGDTQLVAKVYSQVHNTYRLDLYVNDENINRLLIKDGFATHLEESLLSKTRHEEMARLRDNTTQDESVSTYIQDEPEKIDRDEEVFKIALRGPFSPYELSFNGMTATSRLRSTRVEQESVNSVLINDEPQVSYPRFLIAATATVNPSGNTISARDTCLLPNIHGIASLLTLLFAPEVELRTDKNQTRITGALCGLGSERSRQSEDKENNGVPGIFPHDEMEVAFDVKFTEKDLLLINNIRFLINQIIGIDKEAIEWAPQKITDYQQTLQGRLRSLVDAQREDMEPVFSPKEYRWKLIDETNLLDCGFEAKPSHLYCYHKAVFFSEKEEVDPRIKKQRELLTEFHEKGGSSLIPFTEEVVCPVCKVVCRHPTGLYLHSETRAHQSWVNSIFKDADT